MPASACPRRAAPPTIPAVLRTGSVLVLGVVATGGIAHADVTGKITLTGTAGRPPMHGKAFTDRIENPYSGGKMLDPSPYLVVVLEQDGLAPPTPPQVIWTIVGESMDHPLLPVLANSDVVIRNKGRRTPTLFFDGHEDLMPKTPLNQGSDRSFKAPAAGSALTLVDEDAENFTGTVVSFDTPYFAIATSDRKSGAISYDLKGAPKGDYHLKVWYRDHWVDGVAQDVSVDKDGKASADLTLPASFADAAKPAAGGGK